MTTELNVVYNEDCFDTFKRIDDKSIDMVLTSPPYDNLRTYNGFSFDFENTAKELFRVLKDGGVAVWVVGDATINGSETGTSFKQALYFKETGFNLHDTMIYHRNSMPLTHKRYEQWFEYMFVFSKGKPKTFNPIMVDTSDDYKKRRKTKHISQRHRNKTGEIDGYKEMPNYPTRIKENVWRIKNGNQSAKSKIAYQHPAIFPEQLAIDHIKSWSNEGDTVLDCFMGSGTTAIACINTKRNYIGCELDKGYYNIIVKRIENANLVREMTGTENNP